MGNSTSQATESTLNQPLLSELLRAEIVDWDLVRHCLKRNPEQAFLYAHGVEPSILLRAVRRSAPPDVVRSLVSIDDGALDLVTHDGQTLMHASSSQSAVVKILLELRPSQAKVRDGKGRLPLQTSRDPLSTQLLINAYPSGITKRSQKNGSLPLHEVFIENFAEPQLLSIYVKEAKNYKKEGGILTRNKKGQTPLMLLIQLLENNFTQELWDVLLDWIQSLKQNLPDLHALIEFGCCRNSSLMSHAIMEFGDHASRRDDQGRTPLHVAAQNAQCTVDALKALLQANPQAPRMTDNEGRLPIDVAAESPGTDHRCLAILMKGEPRAVNTRDLRDGCYPFVTSAMNPQQDATITYALLRARPEVLSYYHTP